jgi:hypothetical protein
MKKCLGIDPKKWAAAKTEEERNALIAASHIDLTPDEIAQREEDERQHAAAQAALAATEYKRLRAAEYPPIGDQLDAIMKWLATETEFNIPAELKSVAMKCMSVKSKYPKPEGE